MTNNKPTKEQLEKLISEEFTLGRFIFDEEKQCFIGDAEVALYITKLADNKYKSVCYYIDGYEVYDEEGEESYYNGNEESAKQQAIDDYNTGIEFMDYPVIYSNISCDLYETDE